MIAYIEKLHKPIYIKQQRTALYFTCFRLLAVSFSVRNFLRLPPSLP
jgi:hypothetical protein